MHRSCDATRRNGDLGAFAKTFVLANFRLGGKDSDDHAS
jgi:hypothetical protein